jgi:uncharacterized protein
MARYAQYAPEFRVQINGGDLPGPLRSSVGKITFLSGMVGASRVEVTIANETLRWLDNPLFELNNSFTLSVRYAPDPFEEVFVGEITGVEATFPTAGMPTMTIVAHDFLQRMTKGTKDRAFLLSLPCIGKFPLPDPAVVALSVGLDLLIPDLDPIGGALSFLSLLLAYAIDPIDAMGSVRIQHGQSDFEFLSTIAKENGWDMYIDQTRKPHGYRLRFQFLDQTYKPDVTLVWGQSLAEFTPKISSVGQIDAVSTRLWISSIKLELVVTLGWDFDTSSFTFMVFPSAGDLTGFLPTSGSVLNIETIGPANLPKLILGELLPRLNNRLTGSGSAVGNLDLRPGRVINLVGLGDTFGGLYRITSTTHTLDQGGYRTSFDVRKEVWFGSLPAPKSPKGLFTVQGKNLG